MALEYFRPMSDPNCGDTWTFEFSLPDFLSSTLSELLATDDMVLDVLRSGNIWLQSPPHTTAEVRACSWPAEWELSEHIWLIL